MSTQAERAFRASHNILPIKFIVVQRDGSKLVQHVDADTRRPGKNPVARRIEEEEMVREVRHALNEYYYGQAEA